MGTEASADSPRGGALERCQACRMTRRHAPHHRAPGYPDGAVSGAWRTRRRSPTRIRGASRRARTSAARPHGRDNRGSSGRPPRPGPRAGPAGNSRDPASRPGRSHSLVLGSAGVVGRHQELLLLELPDTLTQRRQGQRDHARRGGWPRSNACGRASSSSTPSSACTASTRTPPPRSRRCSRIR